MATGKQLHRIATNPKAYIDFVSSGRLPRRVEGGGPLLALLQQIAPRDRCNMRGFTVDRALGYEGSRPFATVEQAMHWLKPADEMLAGDAWPAESWRNKRFQERLSLKDVLAKCRSYPTGIEERYGRL